MKNKSKIFTHTNPFLHTPLFSPYLNNILQPDGLRRLELLLISHNANPIMRYNIILHNMMLMDIINLLWVFYYPQFMRAGDLFSNENSLPNNARAYNISKYIIPDFRRTRLYLVEQYYYQQTTSTRSTTNQQTVLLEF